MLTLRRGCRPLIQKSLSARLVSTAKPLDPAKKLKGAWRVLYALEKAKEAQSTQAAQLVSSLEALLPRVRLDDEDVSSQQHTFYQEHTSDPAFFSLPEVTFDSFETKSNHEAPIISGDDVRELLKATRKGKRISLHTIEALVKAATSHFQKKPKVVSLPSLQSNQQLTVVGDLHGSLSDLEAVLGLTGEPSENNILLFNGDFADRGDHGIEIIGIVCALCLAYPQFVHLNRGNHEDLALSIAYGLAAEVQHKYGSSVFRIILSPILDAFFRSLPLATVVDNDALIVHAGPPPPETTLSDVKFLTADSRGMSRTIYNKSDTNGSLKQRKEEEVIEALLWSDPMVDHCEETLTDYHGQMTEDGEELGWVSNTSRGAGHKFDASMVRAVLEAEGLSRLVRSHEPVEKGCARYVVDGGSFAERMEFFTVFSASRYPHKEGFNQGAVLKLKPNGKHTVLRYATEEDEPLVHYTFTEFDDDNHSSIECAVDSGSILQALQHVAALHRIELVEALEDLSKQLRSNDLPFDAVVDVLIRTFRLDMSGLKKPGAMLAFAKALAFASCEDEAPPATIRFEDCINVLLVEDGVDEMTPYVPWLRAVFEMVDMNHDGVLDRSEWLDAVRTINSSLPQGTKPVNAEATWALLDVNGDGHVSSSQWDQLGKAFSR
jgi:Calcineurin-like phosphoesterase/EF hand